MQEVFATDGDVAARELHWEQLTKPVPQARCWRSERGWLCHIDRSRGPQTCPGCVLSLRGCGCGQRRPTNVWQVVQSITRYRGSVSVAWLILHNSNQRRSACRETSGVLDGNVVDQPVYQGASLARPQPGAATSPLAAPSEKGRPLRLSPFPPCSRYWQVQSGLNVSFISSISMKSFQASASSFEMLR